jgi:hypothetical protein
VELLRVLLGGNACVGRRGEWWTRLAINLEHLGRTEDALEVCVWCGGGLGGGGSGGGVGGRIGMVQVVRLEAGHAATFTTFVRCMLCSGRLLLSVSSRTVHRWKRESSK